jgi:hypothetical protein
VLLEGVKRDRELTREVEGKSHRATDKEEERTMNIEIHVSLGKERSTSNRKSDRVRDDTEGENDRYQGRERWLLR